MYKDTEKEEQLNRLQQTDLLKKIANKKRKRFKEKQSKIRLFILYNLRDFDVISDKRRKRIKEKLIKLCLSSVVVYSL